MYEIFCTPNAHIFTMFLKGYIISNLNKVVMTRNWTVDNYVMTKTVPHVLNYTRLDIFEQKRLSAQEIFAASSIVSFQLNSFSMNETWIWNMWAALKSCKATFLKKQSKNCENMSVKKNLSKVQITSTLCGQHSTARVNNILASSGSSSSTAAFHNLTELGICSNAKWYLTGVIKDFYQQVQPTLLFSGEIIMRLILINKEPVF